MVPLRGNKMISSARFCGSPRLLPLHPENVGRLSGAARIEIKNHLCERVKYRVIKERWIWI